MIQSNTVVGAIKEDLTECAADHTLTLMLAIARRAAESEGRTAWLPSSLAGKTLGLIGFGRVGQAVARRAAWGFGMDVVAYDSAPIAPDLLSSTGARAAGSLDELLAQSDVVSLHCLSGAESRHVIDARRLDQMKPGAFLIDTPRGGAIEQRSLVHALWFETIAGAGLDGEVDMLPELRACPNAVVLPDPDPAAPDTMGVTVVDTAGTFFEPTALHDRIV